MNRYLFGGSKESKAQHQTIANNSVSVAMCFCILWAKKRNLFSAGENFENSKCVWLAALIQVAQKERRIFISKAFSLKRYRWDPPEKGKGLFFSY